MKKETKQEVKELSHVFACMVISAVLVVQCHNLFGGTKFAESCCAKKEKTAIKSDTVQDKTAIIRDDLYRGRCVKSR